MDELTTINQQPVSKVHTWMLILLCWIATFSLITVGLLLTKSSPSLSTSDISIACQTGALNGITTNLTRISDACSASLTSMKIDGKEVTTTPVVLPVTEYDAKNSNGYLPKLTLPNGWTGSLLIDNSYKGANFHGMKGIAFDCNECGGIPSVAEFTIFDKLISDTTKVEDAAKIDINAVQADYDKQKTTYSGIIVTTEALANGTLVHIDGNYHPDGVVPHAGVFHILRFASKTQFIELTFYEDSGATNAEWLTVKNSLDWSTVK